MPRAAANDEQSDFLKTSLSDTTRYRPLRQVLSMRCGVVWRRMASHGVAGPAAAGAAKTGRIAAPQLGHRHDGQVKGARVGFGLPKECPHPIVGWLSHSDFADDVRIDQIGRTRLRMSMRAASRRSHETRHEEFPACRCPADRGRRYRRHLCGPLCAVGSCRTMRRPWVSAGRRQQSALTQARFRASDRALQGTESRCGDSRRACTKHSRWTASQMA